MRAVSEVVAGRRARSGRAASRGAPPCGGIRGVGIAALLWAVSGCTSTAGPEPGPVEIRVRNASTLDYANVVIGFPHQTETYGAVMSGQETPYRTIELAYRYAQITVVIEDEVLILQPVDYVGEEPLGKGSYTYEIDTLDDVLSITFRLVKD